MPIVLTPIVGIVYDRYGFRMWLGRLLADSADQFLLLERSG